MTNERGATKVRQGATRGGVRMSAAGWFIAGCFFGGMAVSLAFFAWACAAAGACEDELNEGR